MHWGCWSVCVGCPGTQLVMAFSFLLMTSASPGEKVSRKGPKGGRQISTRSDAPPTVRDALYTISLTSSQQSVGKLLPEGWERTALAGPRSSGLACDDMSDEFVSEDLQWPSSMAVE